MSTEHTFHDDPAGYEAAKENEAERLARESSVEAYVDEERSDVTEKWEVKTLEEADWALSRVKDADVTVAEVERLHAAAVARLEVRRDELLRKPLHVKAFFSGLLRKYAEANRKDLLKGGKAKSRKLMFGSIGWRKSGGDPVITDKDALLAWCLKQPVESELLRVKQEPAWDAVKKHVKDTGEVVPGVSTSPETEVFEIKPVKES